MKNNSDKKGMKILTDKEDAIKESLNNPCDRVEIFNKLNNSFLPTYNYIKNGQFINASNFE
jgi:hypothetical protein